jgi:hypothetical protein
MSLNAFNKGSVIYPAEIVPLAISSKAAAKPAALKLPRSKPLASTEED